MTTKLQDYKCKNCGDRFTAQWFDSKALPGLDCPECGEAALAKIFSFSTTRPMKEFTGVTGQPVSSMRQLREQLKVASATHQEQTGYPADFQPVDLRDREALGVTEEGLESTYKNLYKEGRLTPKFIST